MSFAPFHLFAVVVAADAGELLNRLHALHIQNGARSGLRRAAHTLALGRVQGAVQAEPGAPETPAPEMIEHCLPGWEVCGEIPPRAPSTQDGEDGVEDITQAVGLRSPHLVLRARYCWTHTHSASEEVARIGGTDTPRG